MKPVPSKRTTLSLQAVQEASSEPVYRRGVQYYRRKKVLKFEENEPGNHIEALVIGSDQIAEFAGTALGKPRDPVEALEQLRAMRGHSVTFHTGLALLNTRTGRLQTALVDATSTLRNLDDAALQSYLDRDRPFDCAGSVKVETLGISLFTRVASDDPTALIGLPLIRLMDMLLAEGVNPLRPT